MKHLFQFDRRSFFSSPLSFSERREVRVDQASLSQIEAPRQPGTPTPRGRGRSFTHPSRFLRGFTLIEVLVVISIIALLVSLLLPSLKKARESAVTLRDSSNIRQFGYGLLRYQNDSRDWVLGYRMPKPADGEDGAFWWSIIMAGNYVENNSGPGNIAFPTTTNLGRDTLPPMRCIADTPARFANTLVRKPYYLTGGTEYIYPGSSGNSRIWLSYTINAFMGDGLNQPTYPLVRTSKVRKNTSSLIYVTCGDSGGRFTALTNWSTLDMFVHQNNTNTLFLDGHVSLVKKEFLTDVEELKP